MQTQTPDNTILDHQPIFFTGICEERNDPLKLGRVKVRIFGIHSDNFDVLNPDDLPWAFMLIPTTESGSSGIGTSKGGILPGTWVFGLFLDGEAKQQPLILGSIQGCPDQPESSPDAFKTADNKSNNKNEDEFKQVTDLGVDLSKGFFDQHEEFLSGYPRPSYTSKSEPDHNRLSRSESLDQTIKQLKDLDKTYKIREGIDRGSESAKHWDENDSCRQSKYPYNTVNETESGIISEKDDTPHAERIHQYFSPGHSYVEWGLQGMGYEYKKTMGDTINIKYSPQECNYTRGRVNETKDGIVTENYGQTRTLETYDTETKTIFDSYKLRAMGQINIMSGGDYILMVNNNIRMTAMNQMDLDVASKYRESFHDTHHSVYWMRQFRWNEGQVHIRRKRHYREKNNETYHSIVIEGRRDLVAIGHQESTISKDYRLFVGAGIPDGDYHYTANRNHFEYVKGNYDVQIDKEEAHRTEEDVHFTYNKNQLQLTAENKDTTIGKNYTKIVIGKEEKKIKEKNRILVGGDRLIAVVKNQQVEIGENYKRKVLKNDDEQVQVDKNLQVEEWFYKTIKNGYNLIKETWWIKTQTRKIIGILEEAWIKKRDHLYESLANHILKTLSIRIGENANAEVGGDVGIYIKGQLRIQAEKGIILSSKEGPFTFGCKQMFTMGSKCEGIQVKAPNLIETPDDIVIPAEICRYEPPIITVNTIDLNRLKELKPPEIPEIENEIDKELDNKKPKGPVKPILPELPELPIKGEFVNNRGPWQADNSLSKDNDESSFG